MFKKYTVLFAALLLSTCALNPAFAADGPAECAPLMGVLTDINAQKPIATVTAVQKEMGDPLRDWLGQVPPVDSTPYDLVAVIVHQNGQYGVVVGWRKDEKVGGASICVALLITPKLAPEFEKITGLKSQSKDDGSI